MTGKFSTVLIRAYEVGVFGFYIYCIGDGFSLLLVLSV